MEDIRVAKLENMLQLLFPRAPGGSGIEIDGLEAVGAQLLRA